MTGMSGDQTPPRPSELKVSDKYDKCIDVGLQRLVYGTLAGAFAGLVLFRTCAIIEIDLCLIDEWQ